MLIGNIVKNSIKIFALFCLAAAAVALPSLDKAKAWGQGVVDGGPQIAAPPSLQDQMEPITSGVYGPFSSYYRPALLFGEEICRLVETDYKSMQVICFPAISNSGMIIGETDEVKSIQAQLVAVNAPNGKPMPEIIVFMPLADMDQKFFSQNITKRLLRKISIFDSPCQLTYQADEQPPLNEDWRCSSFLNYFDKYSGQQKLYYELRARPVALRSTSEKTEAAMAEKQDWYDFFKTLQGQKEFNISLRLDEDFTIESTLNLDDYAKWIDSLLAVPQSGESDPQFESIKLPEKIYGPFSKSACDVDRYVRPDKGEHHKRLWLYEDIFLIKCEPPKLSPDDIITADKILPKWLYGIFDYRSFKGSAANTAIDMGDISVHLRFQGFKAPSAITISSALNSLFINTNLNFSLSQMKPDFFNSILVRDALNDLGKLQVPCDVSFTVDGEPAGSESFKCDVSYQMSWADITFNIEVDYGLVSCLRFGDKACAKAVFTKATSFLKNVNEETREIVMEIQFESGETISSSFDLDKFDFTGIQRFLEGIEALQPVK